MSEMTPDSGLGREVPGRFGLPDGPQGIGGWLIVPLVQLILLDLAQIVVLIRRIAAAITAAQGHHVAAAAIHQLMGLRGYIVMGLNTLLVLFVLRRHETPPLMSAFYAVFAAALAFYGVSYANGATWTLNHPVSSYPLTIFAPFVLNIALLVYFRTSVRVQNTFVRVAPPETALRGIGGGLLVPIAAMVLITIIGIVTLFAKGHAERITTAIELGQWMLALRRCVPLVLLVLPVVCVAFVLLKKRIARWLMLAYFGIWTVVGIASLIKHPPIDRRGLLTVAICLGCVVYLALSRRVKNTFVN